MKIIFQIPKVHLLDTLLANVLALFRAENCLRNEPLFAFKGQLLPTLKYLKSDLGGTIFAYDYRMGLTCDNHTRTTFRDDVDLNQNSFRPNRP